MVGLKRNISFNEPLHRYTDEDENIYTSVTTLIGNYHPKFDEMFWAKKKAAEAGIPIELVLKNWKDIRDFSCEKGTAEHKVLEDSINESNGKSDFKFDTVNSSFTGKKEIITINKTNLELLSKTALAQKYPSIYIYLRDKILNGWSLIAEKRIYWYEYLVAGTIDCLLISGKRFIIVDWKTNKDELKFKSGYYKKVNGIKTDIWVDKKEYFFKPVQSIENCKGSIYTLQLSLYAYLLSLWGFTCVDLVLFHIRDRQEPKLYKIDYWQWAAELILIDNKNASTLAKSIKSTNNGIEKFGIS